MPLTCDAIYQKRRRLEAALNGYCNRCYLVKAREGKKICIHCTLQQKIYRMSPLGQASTRRYLNSPKGKAKIKRQIKKAAPHRAEYLREWKAKRKV